MSYTIIYDKQFIKVGDNQYIPMVLAGSNNCTETSPSGYQRRERSWTPWFWGEGTILTMEMMLKIIEVRRQTIIERNNNREHDANWKEYKDANYGYWGSLAIGVANTGITSFAKYQGIIKTGCSKALTIEQLKACNVHINIKTPYVWDGLEKVTGLKPYTRVPNTTEEFFEMYETMVEYLKGTEYTQPSITFGYMSDNKVTQLRKKYFPQVKQTKKLVTLPGRYVIVVSSGGERLGQFIKFGRYGSFTYHYSGGGKHYVTEVEANRRLKVCERKRGGDITWRVEKIEQKREFLVTA